MENKADNNKFNSAIKNLYKLDYSIIKSKCSERAIVFRLGLYLVRLFKSEGVDVDCEYNRNQFECKSLQGKKYNYPDIIIHKRGSNKVNLLVIEVKTPSGANKNGLENDKSKLIGFTTETPYKYAQGIHVYISEAECCIAWYIQGVLCDYYKYIFSENKNTLYQKKISSETMCKFDKFHYKEIFTDKELFKKTFTTSGSNSIKSIK